MDRMTGVQLAAVDISVPNMDMAFLFWFYEESRKNIISEGKTETLKPAFSRKRNRARG